MLPASAVMVKVASLVMPSLAELPLSVASASTGAAGAIVSIVTAKASLSGLLFPAASVALAVKAKVPLPVGVKVKVPGVLPSVASPSF